MTLHFRDRRDAVSLRHGNRVEITVHVWEQNPIRYDFRGDTNAIQYSVTIASPICTISPSLLKLYLHIPQQLRGSKRQNLWPRTTTTKKGENVLSN